VVTRGPSSGPVRRFDVHLVALDPTTGSEIQKTGPCLIVSPDEMNRHLRTLIIAPMTSKGKRYPSRVPCRFDGRDGLVVLDRLRTIDRARLVGRLGRLEPQTCETVIETLQEMFSP
jgi:mRNA interferase MazF